MRNLYLRLVVLSMAFSVVANAQQTKKNQNEAHTGEFCAQNKVTEDALKADPEFARLYKENEARELEIAKSGKKQVPAKGVVYRIPVVFHVLHNNGPENISRDQCVDALNILNRDYRLRNDDAATVHDDFKDMPSDVELEFVFATKAPDGTCFSGITRTQTTLTNEGASGTAQVNAVVQGNDVFRGQWPPNKYMNVYIANKLIDGAAGYTYRPVGGSSMVFNGIFMLQNYTGSIGTSNAYRSRALTHEVGHWYNLAHTWGNGSIGTCGDDQVDDTPTTRGSQTCALNENECGPRANVENYMDYSYCSKMFTPLQVEKMRIAATNSSTGRANLWSPANIAATGADSAFTLCSARFIADQTVMCAGGTVQFTDESFNKVSGWSWSFPGGIPETSTEQNPTVVYNTPGKHAVTLVATDGGTSRTSTKTAFITVLDEGLKLPYSESFENYTTLNSATSFYRVENPNNNNAWEVYTGAGSTGNKCVRLRNFNETPKSLDYFTSGNYDLSDLVSTDQVTYSFKFAYRRRVSTNNESLLISASNDCGDLFVLRKTMSGPSLSFVSEGSEWTPSQQDWVQVHVVNISSTYFTPNTQVRFQFDSDGGNNVYIDDINFYRGSSASLGVEELTSANNISVYPNPADEIVNLSFDVAVAGQVVIEIKDLTGKTIGEHVIQASAGENLVMLNTADYSQGMYLMNVKSGNLQKTIQFAVK